MKKLIMITAVIAICAGTAMPYINGMVMEKMVRQSTQNINQTYADSGSDMKIEIQQYERGFSRSIIEWKIDFGMLSNIYGIDEILFVEEAEHGYKEVISETRLDKNQWFTDFVEKQLGGKNPLHIQTIYPLKGDIVSTLVMDAFTLDDGAGFTVQIKPARVSFSMDKAFEQIGSTFFWEGCDVPDKLLVTDIGFNTRMKKISTHIWAGKTMFHIDTLQAVDKGEQVDFSRVKMETNVDYNQEKNQLSASMGIGCESLVERETEQLKDAFVKLSVNRMDAAGYERVAQLYTAMARDMIKAMGEKGFDPDRMEKMFQQQAAAQSFKIMAEAEKLLKNGLEIQISGLKARLPQGQISGDFRVGLKRDMTLAQFVPIMMQPKMALDIFSLQSRLSLPESLVGTNANLLKPVYPGMQTGLFVKNGAGFTHEAETRDGKLFLNQKQVVLE